MKVLVVVLVASEFRIEVSVDLTVVCFSDNLADSALSQRGINASVGSVNGQRSGKTLYFHQSTNRFYTSLHIPRNLYFKNNIDVRSKRHLVVSLAMLRLILFQFCLILEHHLLSVAYNGDPLW